MASFGSRFSTTEQMFIPYIRNNGLGSYIDTGIKPDDTTRIIVWARNFNPNGGFLFGSRVADQDDAFALMANTGTMSGCLSICYGDDVTNPSGDHFSKLSNYHKYELNGNELYIDDKLVATASGGFTSNNHNIHLFGLNSGGAHVNTLFKMDICAAQIYKGENLVRNFTVTRTPSVGMYDSVSNTVFTNAGSGSFAYGRFDVDAYTPLEYITTSGNSYFLTPAIGAYSLPIITKFVATGTASANYDVIGGRDATNRCQIYTGTASYPNARTYGVIGTSSSPGAMYGSSTAGAVANKNLVIVKYNNQFTTYNNKARLGSTVTSSGVSSSYSTGVPLGIGASWQKNNSSWINPFVGRIYYVGLGDYNFVPAKVNGVVGMYDTYNDIFYSSISGTAFEEGPKLLYTMEFDWNDGSGDKLYLHCNNPAGNQVVSVESDANEGATRSRVVNFTSGNISRQLAVQQAGAYDARIEYLQSSGSQYIQLPVTCNANTYFEVSGVIIPVYSNNNKYSIFGASPDAQLKVKFYSLSNNRITYSSTMGTISANGGFSAPVGEATEILLSTTTVMSDGSSASVSRPITSKITGFRLFASYENSNRYPIKICSFKIKVGTTLVYDLIPVRVGQVGYMYDKLSGTLYGNSGSGNFILGNDI